MRKVVDSNYLQNPQLREYLSKSKNNVVVLTDYAAMEAYKGNTLASIYKSMAILSQFADQVLILKSTRTICGLNGRGAGLQKRFIHESQTKEFCLFCQNLTVAAGDEFLEKQLCDYGREATKQLERMLADAQSMPKTFEDIAKVHTSDEIRILRTERTYSKEMTIKIIANVLHIAAIMFDGHPNVQSRPPLSELRNTFIFRTALCAYLLCLEWISVGGARGVNVAKIRNDIVDVNFAAYATYFDGLLSNDGKAQRIHLEARRFLNLFDFYCR